MDTIIETAIDEFNLDQSAYGNILSYLMKEVENFQLIEKKL